MLIYVPLTDLQFLINQLIQIVLITIIPILAIRVSFKYKNISFLSPIVICFAVGIIVRNLGLLPINEDISGFYRDASILYALPLLLFSSDIKAWIKYSRQTIFSFGLAVFAAAFAVIVCSLIFTSQIDDIWIPGGMIGGIHTGGTPNLFAVGMALGAQDEVYTLSNSAQILWGGINLFFMLSIGQKVYTYFLRPFPHSAKQKESAQDEYLNYDMMSIRDIAISLMLVTIIVGLSIGISFLIFNKLEATLIVVFVTTISLICSFSQYIRTLKGPFEIGDYCLLMFGVAVGMMSDFRELIQAGGPYVLFIGMILLLTIMTQLLLSKLFRIDTDTFIITSTAAIYGPVFIPQVARVLKNKSIIVGGIAVSLIGLAIGNYIGIGLAYLIKFLISG